MRMHAICMMDSNHLSLKLMAKKKDIFQVFHHFQYKDTANVCTLPLKVLSVLRREKKLFFYFVHFAFRSRCHAFLEVDVFNLLSYNDKKGVRHV